MAIITEISAKNKRDRVKYGEEHQNKTIDSFWQYVYFTDKAHIDPSQSSQIWILRKQGTRYESENMQNLYFQVKQKFHVAAIIF
jgi:hypothetical protein